MSRVPPRAPTLLLLLLLLPSCGRSPPAPAFVPSHAATETPRAGRYAMLLDTHHQGGCSMSSFFTSSRASIVLTLGDDGSASGCRGRRWTSTMTSNEGDPRPDTTEIVEQQGMSGTWQREGEGLRVDLALDDSICPRVRNAASEDAKPWSLECVALVPSPTPKGAEPEVPALACKIGGIEAVSGSGIYPHDLGYTVAESSAWFQRDTIFLGPEPGVVIAETAFGGMSPDGTRRWSKPASPIAFDAWSRPPTAP